MIIDYGIIRSFAHATEWAVKKYGRDPVSFLTGCFKWDGFDSYADNFALYTQSSSCIAGKILKAISQEVLPIRIPEEAPLDEEDGFWMGYIVMYWAIAQGATGSELLQYDWELVRDAYDTLHTTTPSYTVDFIKNNYHL